MNTKSLEYQRLSEVLKYIRIPFFILIVFIHNTNTAIIENVDLLQIKGNYPLFYYVSEYISEVIARIAVPGFFLISGYFFFLNKELTWNTYLFQIKKKFKSLFLPFAFWNTLSVLLLVLVPIFIPALAHNEHVFSWRELFSSLWCSRNGHALNQLWYVRDLMCCILISPLFYYFFRKARWFILFLFVLWFFDLEIPKIGPYGFSNTALFWFFFGSLMGMNSFNFVVRLSRKYWLLILGFALSFADLFTVGFDFNPYLHKIFILFGLLGCFCGLERICGKYRLNKFETIANASFFVYLFHLPWVIIPVRMLLIKLLHPVYDIQFLVIYFVVVLLTIVISLITYYLIINKTPQMGQFLTGGR